MMFDRADQDRGDDVYRHVEAAGDALTVRRVFGEAYEVGGATVIPVARVIGGAGTGSGRGAVRPTRASLGTDDATPGADPAGASKAAQTGDAGGDGAAAQTGDAGPAGESETVHGPGLSGSMGSFAACARPAGVFVIRDGEVSWKPAWSLNAALLGGQVLGGVVALAAAGVLRTWAKRGGRLLRRR